jgi:hypothetical protein
VDEASKFLPGGVTIHSVRRRCVPNFPDPKSWVLVIRQRDVEHLARTIAETTEIGIERTMNKPDSPDSLKGHYLGTEIEGKWWKRYRKDGFLARGNGEYWFDENTFYFRRYLTKKPLEIPLRKIFRFEIAKAHAGQWIFRRRVLKLFWEKDGVILSSGFVVARNQQETEAIMADVQRQINH